MAERSSQLPFRLLLTQRARDFDDFIEMYGPENNLEAWADLLRARMEELVT